MAATDSFQNMYASLDSPGEHAAAVTPSDTADLTNVTRALYVGVAGNITVNMKDGTQVAFANMPVGWHPLRVSRVFNTGTTASSIVAVW